MNRPNLILPIVLTLFLTAAAQNIKIETVMLSTEFPNVLTNSVSAEYPRLYKIDPNITGITEVRMVFTLI